MHLEKLVLHLRFEVQECSAVNYCPVLCVEKLSKKQQTSAIDAERSAVWLAMLFNGRFMLEISQPIN